MNNESAARDEKLSEENIKIIMDARIEANERLKAVGALPQLAAVRATKSIQILGAHYLAALVFNAEKNGGNWHEELEHMVNSIWIELQFFREADEQGGIQCAELVEGDVN